MVSNKNSISEKTAKTYKNEILELGRFFALTLVFFYHANAIIPFGYLGVDFFFVLSGFFIAKSISTKSKVTAFIAARTSRITPTYIFCLIITVITTAYLGMGQAQFWQLLSITTFTTNWAFALSLDYDQVFPQDFPYIHFWTLAIEVQFYAYVAATKAFRNTRNLTLMGALIIAVIIAASIFEYYVFVINSADPYFSSILRFSQLYAGYFAYKLIYHKKVKDLIIITALVPISLFIGGIGHIITVVFSIILAFYASSDLSQNWLNLGRTKSVMVGLGGITYTGYMFHAILLFYLGDETLKIVSLIVSYIILLFFCFIFNRYIEIPTNTASKHALEKYLSKNKLPSLYISCLSMIVLSSIALAVYTHETKIVSNRYLNVTANEDIDSLANFIGNNNVNLSEAPSILVVGNSHGIDGLNIIYETASNAGYQVHLSGMGACPPIEHFHSRDECISLNNLRFQAHQYDRYDMIVISTLLTPSFTILELREYVRFVQSLGKEVLVFGTHVKLDERLDVVLTQEQILNPDEAGIAIVENHIRWIGQHNDEIAALCEELACHFIDKTQTPNLIVDNGNYFTLDRGHLTFEYATLLGRRLSSQILAAINSTEQ